MKIKRLIFLLLFTITILPEVIAQNTDPEAIAKELKGQLRGAKDEKTQKSIEKFFTYWEGGSFSDEEKISIANTVNLMLSKRYLADPDLQEYVRALAAFKDFAGDLPKLKAWNEALQNNISDKRGVRELNGTFYSIFADSLIYSSKSKVWKITSPVFTVSNNNNKLVLKFNTTDLICATKGDSIIVRETTGKFYPNDLKWKGKGGKLTWERVKFSPNEVFAELNKYKVNVRESELKADTVQFTHKKWFSQPIEGSLSDKAFQADVDEKNASYPQFKSFKNRFKIESFAENLVYIGGFSLEGAQVLGTGSEEQAAKIIIKDDGKKRTLSESRLFVIEPGKIVSSKTNSRLYFANDSIYHPNLSFTYFIPKKQIILKRAGKGVSESPFFSSYHKMEIDLDELVWLIDSQDVHLQMKMNSFDPARFSSDKFYRQEEYLAVQSILQFHPLEQLQKFVTQYQKYTFTDREFAGMLGINNTDNVKRLLINLARDGFILYDIEKGEIKINDKVIHYIKANKNRTDHDFITLESVISKKSNAVLSLETYDLTIEGVGRAILSDSQSVFIFPKDQMLTIKKNRDMEFDGQVVAGRFHFFGDSLYFNYDSFKIDMVNVDSLRLYYPNEKGKLRRVNTVLQDIFGSLYIDHPNNKSGRVSYSKYPLFDCKEGAMVYYDKQGIYDSVYNRERFYFEVKPFKVDSLDNFTMQGVTFDGTFHSANIFPTFDHYLHLMDDYSLGFQTYTPDEGYPLYQGKGKGKMRISLSNKGLWGAGTVDYLPSTTTSEKFLFFPDSMNVKADEFVLPEEGQDKYPAVAGINTYNHWLPYRDSMFIYQRSEPISVYKEGIDFSGDLILTPEKLMGSGKVEYKDAVITADNFGLAPKNIDSDSANFKLKSSDKNKAAFSSKNITVNLDLESNILLGESNEENAVANFELNRYQTSIRAFRWNIEENNLTLKTPDNQSPKDAYMVSTDPDQDSLKFLASSAFFDLDNYTIEAKDIPFIRIADAKIFPPKGEVIIEKSANMRSLEGAKIIADTTHEYHTFYDAFINVFSTSKFSAYGTYDYVNMKGEKQKIFFKDIRVEEGKTIARGQTGDTANFYLNPKIIFSGKVMLMADKEEMIFDGFGFPSISTADELKTQWFSFIDTIRPDSVYITLKDSKGKDGKPLVSGLYVEKVTRELYPVFLGTKINPDDQPVFTADGVFYYDFENSKFILEPVSRIKDSFVIANHVFYDEANQKYTGKGNLNISMNNKVINLETGGKFTTDLTSDETIFDLVMAINFPFDETAMKMMSDSVLDLSFNNYDTRDNRPVVETGLNYVVKDPKIRKRMLEDLFAFNLITANKEFAPNFLVSDLQMKWNADSSGLISVGNKIGIATIKETNINKRMKGGFYLKQKPGVDAFTLYFQSNPGNWYFFNYRKGLLEVIGSDIEFSNYFLETAKKVSKGKYELNLARISDKTTYKLYFQ